MNKKIFIYTLLFIIICVTGLLLGIEHNKNITSIVIQKMSDGYVGMRAGREIIQSNEILIKYEQRKNITCYIKTIVDLPISDFTECKNNPICISQFNKNQITEILEISNDLKDKDCKIN
ncbi:hypothetical protein [Comamonas sp.]|uniref:hypothetical protein n=1 Tax=Comamonas sp. TaxID=34028 RepID=UPI0028987C4E|nr:hypothetical protein [Comamonas sp.]